MTSVEHAELPGGQRLAYWRAGHGGFPLVLLHGYPETKRIYARTVAGLADAGFEVLVPDLRGHGDSAPAVDGHYDIASFSADVHALVHDVLGHRRCVLAGGDIGGAVVQDVGLRWSGFVDRQLLFNTIVPRLPEAYAAAGIPPEPDRAARPTADYFFRQGTEPDALLAELPTAEQRRRYVADFYTHRMWASPGSFTPSDVDYLTEPFADAGALRASWGVYEVLCRSVAWTEKPLLYQVNPVPTLVLWGPADHVIHPTFPARCAVAFPECVGPFTVDGAGHFLPWERPVLFTRTLDWFCRDLTAGRRGTC